MSRQQLAMLALKLGESLEEVLGMEEEERGQLLQLLVLEQEEVNGASDEEDNVSSSEEDNASSDVEEIISSDEGDMGTFEAYQEVVRAAEREAEGLEQEEEEVARLVGMVDRLVEEQEAAGLEELVDTEEGVLEEQDVEVARFTEDEDRIILRKREEEEAKVARLAAELGAMFPSTPAAYLVHRCEDLVGREEAIERLVLELLEDPLPRPGWADLECPCCLDPACLEERMVACAAGHLYCAACVNAAAAIAVGENRAAVPCLGACREEMDMRQMEKLVEAATIARLQQRRQEMEVAGAGLEGLVTCPFCLYSVVMEGDRGRELVCGNPGCGRNSCRACGEASHRPLACHQVEGTEAARKEVEEQLTLAMIRRCWKCGNKVPSCIPIIRGATGSAFSS